MAWTDPGAHVWTTSEVVTAASMNTYLRLNLSFLGSTSVAVVSTAETRANVAYGDLATSGPAVTVTTGVKALVIIGGLFQNNTNPGTAFMSYAVSGATTLAAADARKAGVVIGGSTNDAAHLSSASVPTLNAGSNTFTAKYRSGGADTATFTERTITVIPLP